MFELVNIQPQAAVIKVIGIGGGGGNAVRHMQEQAIEGVEFICANTDRQVLEKCGVRIKIQLGGEITKGLGAGADPEIGRKAAMEERDSMVDALNGSDMVFITAGMGGGTGTGAAPVAAQVAREIGILTVAVVTRPFSTEGRKRAEIAERGIRELAQHVDSLIIIPNERLLSVLDPNISMLDAFAAANDVLLNAVQGIAELITRPSLINVDFSDVRTVMAEMGMAMIGAGRASGEGRARKAAEMAVSSPLLEDINLSGAKGMLVNITCGADLGLKEYHDVSELVGEYASDDANVVVGTSIDADLVDEMRVTVVATGLGGHPATRQKPVHEATPARPVGRPTDYRAYDPPTVIRKREQQAESAENQDMEPKLLDVPAFLRRQAD